MKKVLMSVLLLFSLLGVNLQANADYINHTDYLRIQNIGNKLLQSNSIKHRYTLTSQALDNKVLTHL